MASRAPLLLASLALAVPAPALAADSSGGTGIPVDGSGGVRSIPGDPAPPEPVAPTRPPAPAVKADTAAPAPTAAAPAPTPVARVSRSSGDDGDVVKVPVPRSDGITRRPAVVAPASLPSTGFDLGLFVAVGMGVLGVGLLLSAVVGPRPARAPRRAR